MAVEVFANDGKATVTSGGTTAPSAGTTETWTLSGSTLPAVSSSDTPPTQCYVFDPAAETEKILVTNISGTTAMVTRGADGTTPVTHSGGFTIQQVITRATLMSVRTRDAVVTDPQFGNADPTGGADSWRAIQNALLAHGTLGGALQGQGGVTTLPPGNYKISKPLIRPAGVHFDGKGWGSQLTLITGSDCDMIQNATYNSSAQAAILGVSASSIANGFWGGVRDMWLHGDGFGTTTPGYRHGINVTTNPTTSAAGGDPDFDPMFEVENVRIEACTGDGYFHNGRSGAFLKRVWVAYCNGIGFVPSFDTTMIDCLAEGCSTGGYFNHGSNVGSGCKFYNNTDNTWVSGTAYSPGNVVVYSGAMYFCILAVSGATVPSSDTAHWTHLTTATAPQANGYDWYWDTGVAAHNWAAVESQEPSKGSFYFKGPNAGTVTVTGQSSVVNYNNGQVAYNAANPNHYAAVTLDGVSNVTVILNSTTQAGGNGVVCTSLNSPGPNTLIATTDGTEASVFNGGTPGFALVNGKFQSAVTGTQSVTSGVVTLTYASTLNIAAGTGNHFRVTLTGNATVAAPTGATDGQKITVEVVQDSTGSRTLTWNSAFDFGTSGTPTLTTTASKRDVLGFVYSSSASKWLFAGSTLGF